MPDSINGANLMQTPEMLHISDAGLIMYMQELLQGLISGGKSQRFLDVLSIHICIIFVIRVKGIFLLDHCSQCISSLLICLINIKITFRNYNNTGFVAETAFDCTLIQLDYRLYIAEGVNYSMEKTIR